MLLATPPPYSLTPTLLRPCWSHDDESDDESSDSGLSSPSIGVPNFISFDSGYSEGHPLGSSASSTTDGVLLDMVGMDTLSRKAGARVARMYLMKVQVMSVMGSHRRVTLKDSAEIGSGAKKSSRRKGRVPRRPAQVRYRLPAMAEPEDGKPAGEVMIPEEVITLKHLIGKSAYGDAYMGKTASGTSVAVKVSTPPAKQLSEGEKNKGKALCLPCSDLFAHFLYYLHLQFVKHHKTSAAELSDLQAEASAATLLHHECIVQTLHAFIQDEDSSEVAPVAVSSDLPKKTSIAWAPVFETVMIMEFCNRGMLQV